MIRTGHEHQPDPGHPGGCPDRRRRPLLQIPDIQGHALARRNAEFRSDLVAIPFAHPGVEGLQVDPVVDHPHPVPPAVVSLQIIAYTFGDGDHPPGGLFRQRKSL